MGSQNLCACDPAREVLINQKIEQFDTVHEAFLTLVERLSNVHNSALWLNPFRGIPKGPRFSRFDVIYLDQEGKVIKCSEGFSEAEKFAAFDSEEIEDVANSALILPSHTLHGLQIHDGDQIRICGVAKVLVGGDEETVTGLRGPRADRCIKQTAPARPVAADPKPKEGVSKPPISQVSKEEKLSLKIRFLRWLFPVEESGDRRRGERMTAPHLIAYYWTGGAPQSFELGDVSDHGLYLLTEERWLPGTRIVMTLQKEEDANKEDISRVESQVVRWGEDGVGCEFVESGFVDLNSGEIVEGRRFDREALQKFLKRVTVPTGSERRG